MLLDALEHLLWIRSLFKVCMLRGDILQHKHLSALKGQRPSWHSKPLIIIFFFCETLNALW